jgi:carbonic anhydrase/acetyltransferase-like protein (isoleucine patch superfamily)
MLLNSEEAKKKFPLITIGKCSYIHNNAVIHGKVKIGKYVGVDESVHIYEGVKLCDEVLIYKGTHVHSDTVIGVRSKIGGLTSIGENVVIDRCVRIHDDVDIHEGAHIQSYATIREGATIKKRAVIGKGATIWHGAVIREDAIIKKGGEGLVLHGSYRYPAGVYFDSRTEEIIVRLGCYHRTVEEWESNFDNNVFEFPLGSPEREARWQTFQFLKKWKPRFQR